MVNIFLHTILLVSLNCHMQLYTFSICFMTTISQLFLPYFLSRCNFIMSLLLFTAFDLSCKAKTNGFAGAQRGCQLTVPEVIWVRRDQQPLPLPQHPVLQAFPLKDEEFFFPRNQMLAMSHPAVKVLVIMVHWFQTQRLRSDQDVYNVSDWVYSSLFGLGRWKQSSVKSKPRPRSFSKSNVLHFVRGENVSLQEMTTNQACCCKQMDADIWYPGSVWDSKEQRRQFCIAKVKLEMTCKSMIFVSEPWPVGQNRCK